MINFSGTYRIGSARASFAQHRKLLHKQNINLKTRVMFLNSLGRARPSYGYHTWRKAYSEISKLLSKINGVKAFERVTSVDGLG